MILADPHHIQIAAAQLTDIAELLYCILFSVDAMIRIARAATARTVAVRRSSENLTPLRNNCDMEALAGLVKGGHVDSFGINQELL